MGARALEFAILTAARSGEVRGATWAEIDLKAAVWTVPGDRMKMGREHGCHCRHRHRALKCASSNGRDGPSIPGAAGRRTIRYDALGGGSPDEGGRRTPRLTLTFRDWASERTNYPRDVAEMALAHAIGDKVEAAYRRGDLFENRRRLMADWATFSGRTQPRGGVVSIRSRAAFWRGFVLIAQLLFSQVPKFSFPTYGSAGLLPEWYVSLLPRSVQEVHEPADNFKVFGNTDV